MHKIKYGAHLTSEITSLWKYVFPCVLNPTEFTSDSWSYSTDTGGRQEKKAPKHRVGILRDIIQLSFSHVVQSIAVIIQQDVLIMQFKNITSH